MILDFRSRLVVVVTTLTVATLGGAFFGVATVVRRGEARRFDRGLVADARTEATHVEAMDAPSLRDRPRVLAGELGPLSRWAVVYDASGAVIAATDNWQGLPPARAEAERPFEEGFDLHPRARAEHLRAVVVPLARPPGGRLLTGASRRELDGDVALLARAMGTVFAVACAWSVLVATWLLRRLTRGHVAIAEVARRVAAGDLRARVGSLATDRETAALARNVDAILDRLSSLLEAQGRFVAHAAHELRSPITALYGELALALRRPREAEGYRAAIEKAHASARDLRALAEDLLVLARVEAASDEEIDVANAAEVVEEAARAHLARPDVRVVTEADGEFVRGRTRDLARMVRNLVDNAVRLSPPGGVVVVRAAREGADVVVTVTDQGPGVPEPERERVFEPFFRAPDARAGGEVGTGLGLAIAREIARAQGGTLVVGARPDGAPGAVFTARLPSVGRPGVAPLPEPA